MNHELSNFSINTLFPSKNSRQQHIGGFNVNTIFKNNNDDDNYTFDSRILLERNNEQKEKLKKYYGNIYRKCCETIIIENKLGFTNIVYEIPQYSECIGYSCHQCINFLSDKLSEQNLTVKKINKTQIYISWHDLEKKIQDKKNNDIDTWNKICK